MSGDVEKACTRCGSLYRLTATKVAMRDQDEIDCEVCGELLHKWSQAKVWEATLIEKHEYHLGKP